MKTRIATLLSGIAAAWIPASALAHSYEDGRGFWPHDWPGGWSHMLFGSFGMIIFWGGLILLIVLAVRWFGGRPDAENAALEALEERFARGEMDKEDFEERKRLLMQ
jgi:putative membrane protein